MLRGSAAVIAFLAVWEVVPRLGLVDRVFLPPFSEVLAAWWQLAVSGELGEHLGASLVRALGGLVLAVVVAIPLGIALGWYRPVAEALNPLLEIFRNTAALALLPVFVLLLGLGESSKIALVMFACSWPILLNTASAVRTVDPLLVRSARSLGFGAGAVFRKVVLPSTVPTLFTGVRLAAAVSLLVLVAAEMAGANAGLGYLITAAQFNVEVPQMYAGILTISLLGLGINQLLVVLERRVSRWRPATG
ncbi:ABC transporter permease [Actinomycetospora sp. OC33-EN07]|uniref:ABC transporter permease n=1 Tax=Actinomycetospora flava TaxID=3129232 RepID=A0ABU8M2E8_9PSEU